VITDKQRAETQEALLHLYLRLNGYFVTSFIVHSSAPHKNITQIDALAVRHRFSRESKREVGPSEFLNPKGTDLLVCEVKSHNQPLQFNESFRESDIAIFDVLHWSGLFNQKVVRQVARELKPLLQPSAPAHKSRKGVSGGGGIRVRPLLCSPETNSCAEEEPWFLCGGEIFSYIAKCLRPESLRDNCSTQYDYDLWGTKLAPLVRYFKRLPHGEQGETRGLYESLNEGL
jgi:hypothetical protein